MLNQNNDILNDLIGEQYTSISLGDNSRLIFVNIDDVYNREDNRPIDSDKVDEIAESIYIDGLGQPPLVRKVEGKEGYEVIAGQHRCAAYAILHNQHPNKTAYNKIPCIIKEIDDVTARRLMLATNVVNNQVSPEARKEYLLELVGSVREERAENPDKYAGKKTAAVVADMITESTGEKMSQATVERTIANRKAEETVGDIDAYLESASLTENWKEFVKENQYRDITSKDVLKLEKYSPEEQSKAYVALEQTFGEECINKKQIDAALSYIKQKRNENLTDSKIVNLDFTNRKIDDFYKIFNDLLLAKNTGWDISDVLDEISICVQKASNDALAKNGGA